MRTHLVLPDKLVSEIDKLVGKRKRSRFVEEAVRQKLKRDALIDAVEETSGALSPEDYPQWDTRHKVAEWVAKTRRQSDERIEKVDHG
ncbi:MAG: hypothetical protein ACOC6S_00205 [Chloroflexota bacterium]